MCARNSQLLCLAINRFEVVLVVVDVVVFLFFFPQLSDSCANWKGNN